MGDAWKSSLRPEKLDYTPSHAGQIVKCGLQCCITMAKNRQAVLSVPQAYHLPDQHSPLVLASAPNKAERESAERGIECLCFPVS